MFQPLGNLTGSVAVRPDFRSSEVFILIMYKFSDRGSDTSRRRAQECISYCMKEWWLLNTDATFSLPAALCNGSSFDLVCELHFGQGMELIFTSPLATYIVYDNSFYLFLLRSWGSKALCLLFLVSQQGHGTEYKCPVRLNHCCWSSHSYIESKTGCPLLHQ